MKKRKRVSLEPELEAMAADWNPRRCLEMSKVFDRWSSQLQVKAFILVRDADDPGPSFAARRARVQRALRDRRAILN